MTSSPPHTTETPLKEEPQHEFKDSYAQAVDRARRALKVKLMNFKNSLTLSTKGNNSTGGRKAPPLGPDLAHLASMLRCRQKRFQKTNLSFITHLPRQVEVVEGELEDWQRRAAEQVEQRAPTLSLGVRHTDPDLEDDDVVAELLSAAHLATHRYGRKVTGPQKIQKLPAVRELRYQIALGSIIHGSSAWLGDHVGNEPTRIALPPQDQGEALGFL
jgi:hypothetical protein